MSFVRVRKTHSMSGVPRKKKTTKKKPVWDDTIQDLTKLKATPEEIEQRKVMHKSKNMFASKLEKQHRENKDHTRDLSMSVAEARQLAIMKEVLYDQQQFQDVINKSDKMMAVVKDLFGDDPKRFTGFPTVTSAPGGDETRRPPHSIVAPVPSIHTRNETLSDSVMDKSALNDLSASDSDEEDDELEPIMYQPKMNMERFQQFLEIEEKNHTLSTISGQAHLSHLDQGPIQSTRIQDTQSLQTTQENAPETPKKNRDDSVSVLRTPRSAMNDTKKIKRTKKRVPQNETTLQNTTTTNLGDLRRVLESLENEIAEFERQTGRRAPAEQPRQETFSGYTMSLVDSVTKLSKYLKENELRLRAETTVREQLTQDVCQLKALVDALTSDIIHTQEEYGKLESEFHRYKQQTHKEITLMKDVLKKVGLLPSELQNGDEKTTTQPKPGMVQPEFYQASQYSSDVPNSIPDHLGPMSSAVLLSPPVRKTRVQNEQENDHYHPARQSVPNGLPHFSDPHVPEQSQHGPDVQRPVHAQNGVPMAQYLPSDTVSAAPSSIQHQNAFGLPQQQQLHQQQQMQQQQQQLQKQQQQQLQQQHHNLISHDSGTFHSSASIGSIPSSAHVSNQQGLVMGPAGQQQFRHPEGQLFNPVPNYGVNRPHSAATRVSVPRPSPLVQSNVDIPINRTDTQVRDHNLSTQTGSDKVVMATHIAELNKQHAEAQKRLQSLMQQQLQLQQEQQGSQQPAPTSQQAHSTQVVRGPTTSDPVSPPISPISERSDNFMSLQGMTQKDLVFNPSARGITVAIPMADLSLESSPSPK